MQKLSPGSIPLLCCNTGNNECLCRDSNNKGTPVISIKGHLEALHLSANGKCSQRWWMEGAPHPQSLETSFLGSCSALREGEQLFFLPARQQKGCSTITAVTEGGRAARAAVGPMGMGRSAGLSACSSAAWLPSVPQLWVPGEQQMAPALYF